MLCTYPEGIEYACITPMQFRKEEYIIYAHILSELNMKTQ